MEEIAGHGVKALLENDEILAGNIKLMRKFNIADVAEANSCGTTVYIAINGKFAGYVTISDEIKQDSKDAIKELNTLGAKTVMLTGTIT